MDLVLKMTVASVEVKESIMSMELMQDKQHETTALLVNTILFPLEISLTTEHLSAHTLIMVDKHITVHSCYR